MTKSLRDKLSLGVIGYGAQGRALALNWRDSGWDVAVALRPRSKSRRTAKSDRIHRVDSLPPVVSDVDIVCFAFPDYLHGRVFAAQIRPHLRAGAALLLLQGMSVHFGQIIPPPDSDVLLLAPHGPGGAVRDNYLRRGPMSAFVAVHHDADGRGQRLVRQLAHDAGFDRTRLIETTFETEAVGDLFGEQVVLCGGLAMLIKYAFETLTERGMRPEHAYLEVAYQLDLIVDLIKLHGVGGMFERISVTAQYGSLHAGPEIIDTHTKRRMASVYDRIASGEFAKSLAALTPSDLNRLSKELKNLTDTQLERAARRFSPKAGS